MPPAPRSPRRPVQHARPNGSPTGQAADASGSGVGGSGAPPRSCPRFPIPGSHSRTGNLRRTLTPPEDGVKPTGLSVVSSLFRVRDTTDLSQEPAVRPWWNSATARTTKPAREARADRGAVDPNEIAERSAGLTVCRPPPRRPKYPKLLAPSGSIGRLSQPVSHRSNGSPDLDNAGQGPPASRARSPTPGGSRFCPGAVSGMSRKLLKLR